MQMPHFLHQEEKGFVIVAEATRRSDQSLLLCDHPLVAVSPSRIEYKLIESRDYMQFMLTVLAIHEVLISLM